MFSDLATDELTFSYQLSLEEPPAPPAALESLRVTTATWWNMTTDVSGNLGTTGEFEATRTADGRTINVLSTAGGAEPIDENFVVAANAVNYAQAGEIGIEASFLFELYDAEGQLTSGQMLSGQGSIENTFRPLLGSPRPPPPPAIPLPAAVWPGMVGLAAVALKIRRAPCESPRRRRASASARIGVRVAALAFGCPCRVSRRRVPRA